MSEDLASDMREYLETYLKLKDIYEQERAVVKKRRSLEDKEQTLRLRLEQSVDPDCGSATKPHIRTYTNGAYQTLTVYYEHQIGRGRLNVTKSC